MSAGPPAATAAVEIRRLVPADLPRVLEIERTSFPIPWSPATFSSLLNREAADLYAAVQGDRLVGYAVAWTVFDEAELGNVAVSDACRGHGVGRRLVEAVLRGVEARGARQCFLEVRESNTPARELYSRLGFEVIDRRRDYYTHPREDALVMRIRLASPGRAGAQP